jgi:O-antigen/teichoic acid export membrane protein
MFLNSTRIKKILDDDINKKIFNHSIWILFGNIVSKFLLLFSTILISKIISKEEYGQFGIIKSTILMFATFAGLELGMTATKYISQYREKDKEKVENVLGLSNLFAIVISLIISVLIYFYSDIIAVKINAPSLSSIIKISSFIVFFSSINGIQAGIFSGIEKFKQLSVNTSIAGIISSLGMLLGAKYYGVMGVIVFFGSNYVILFILNFAVLKKIFYSQYNVNIFRKSNFQELNVLWKFSLPAVFAGLMVGPVTWVCNYFLVNQHSGFTEMAYFDIANQWRNTILFIPAALSQIALPMLSSALESKHQYKSTYIKNLKLNVYVAGAMVIVFVLLSPLIIFTYGSEYKGAQYPLVIMLITTGLIAVNNVIGQVIASKNKMWIGFYVNMLWGMFLIFFSYIFIVVMKMGAVGISLAYLLSYLLHTIIQFLFIKNLLKI